MMTGLDNDTRGWIMASVSGIACCAGACIIGVDLLVRYLPRFHDWRIQDSNTFLSSSLSLSFGVMLYSALYSMLPSARSYLVDGGISPRPASFMLTGYFLGGVIGITVISRFIHHHMPSQVVDCDHTHDEENDGEHRRSHTAEDIRPQEDDEDTPLLSRSESYKPRYSLSEETRLRTDAPSPLLAHTQSHPAGEASHKPLRPSLTQRVTTFMSGGKNLCDETGPCHGYTDPCGQECFKVLGRSPTRSTPRRFLSGTYRTITSRGQLRGLDVEAGATSPVSPRSAPPAPEDAPNDRGQHSRRQSSTVSEEPSYVQANGDGDAHGKDQSEGQAHHHHVPTNAFLSIGLQTSIAIALHKLPEGFITYATNHANPKLGFAVFMALFIHNITEGFAMALPLYLAIGSRFHAIFWSSLLGGLSQPLGAGIAALWLNTAKSHDMLPSEAVYGAMFAVTAGIMTTVALQLFSESVGLTHNKNLCVAFAFVGMGILGISNALTA